MNNKKFKNKKAVEFNLVSREPNDPLFEDLGASNKVFVHIPKEHLDETEKQKQEKMLDLIPSLFRGNYNVNDEEMNISKVAEKYQKNELTKDEVKDILNKFNQEKFIKETQNNLKMQKEEIIDTNKEKPLTKSSNLLKIENLDDRDIDLIFKNLKLDDAVKFTKYNEYDLKEDDEIDPEVLQYVTKKEFNEETDIFIPPTTYVDLNRFDIDIKPEDMNDEYKEVYRALNAEDENDNDAYDELEDDFIILANGGIKPVEFDSENIDDVLKKEKEENTKEEKKVTFGKKTVIKEQESFDPNVFVPKYKFITPEEKEFLNKKFEETYKNEYQNDNKAKKDNVKKVDKEVFDDAVNEILKTKQNKTKTTNDKKYNNFNAKDDDEDEENYEDYEYDEDEEYEDYEYDEEEELDDNNNKTQKEEEAEVNLGDLVKNIEYKGNKKQISKPEDDEEQEEVFTIKDLDNIIKDEEIKKINIELLENFYQENVEGDIEVHYPKNYSDISQLVGTKKYFPKVIGNEVNYNKKTYKPRIKREEIQNKEDDKLKLKDENNIKDKDNNNHDQNEIEETKEDKLKRKKAIKEEKREKRKQKKELKEVYKKEKTKQLSQIAKSNSVIRYGLSVREV